MLPENITAVVARNERWEGTAASEPYEAGWAREAVIFVRTLKTPQGPQPHLRAEISPDGMHWIPEGSEAPLPSTKNGIAVLRLSQFGNWLRVAADFAPGSEAVVLVTIHLKG